MSERTQTPMLSGQFSMALVYTQLTLHNELSAAGVV